MRIIVGHANMDLDCLGSMVLARTLYPGARAVGSRFIHPVARTLYNLYADHLDLLPVNELAGQEVDGMVVVDTRSLSRIAEVAKALGAEAHFPPTEVWDHHPADSSDIPGAVLHEGAVGANATLLGKEVMARGISIRPEDATIALAGIYADTGNFTHENVSAADFEVAGWLKANGAQLSVVKTVMQTLKEGHQITLFHDLLNRLTYQSVHGHFIITAYVEMERQVGGLAAVVEKVFEVEGPDALFAVFFFGRENETLIVARSSKHAVDAARLLASFGGGGHAQASSALVKGAAGRTTYHALQACLKAMLGPAATARSIMSLAVTTIPAAMPLKEAAALLEGLDKTGAPVVDGRGAFCGYLTLRDVAKGRRAGQMAAPVSSHMTRKVATVAPEASLREIESLLFTHAVYDLPVLAEGRVVGQVTRDAFLKARDGE